MNATSIRVDLMNLNRVAQHRATRDCCEAFLRSVRAGRPMTLPNLLRLHQRLCQPNLKHLHPGDVAAEAQLLEHAYRANQPFRR